MKKLFRKELREETKVALLGLAVFTLVLLQVYKSCTSELASVASGQSWQQGDVMQPLLSSELHNEAGCFCAIFGIVLGWLQIRAEKHRDLWAFLIHRPITRTAILRGKIASGLCLYAVGAGLPLLGFIAIIWTPGHVAAPFEWEMTLPVAAIFLLGIVYYFAGMLTGLRQARWHGSRGFGLGLAVFATLGVFTVQEFWQALLVLLMTGGILVVAVWGSFQSGGYYRSQTMPGKVALTLACVAATVLLVGVAVIGLNSLFASETWSTSDYEMTVGGIICKVTRHAVGDPEIVDLNGKPFLDNKKGKPMKSKDLDRLRPEQWMVFARFGRQAERKQWRQHGYTESLRFFNPWQVAEKAYWYFTHDGRVVGYDGITRRLTATLEAGGNSAGPSRAETGFIPENYNGDNFNSYAADQKQVLASSTMVYLENFENRALKPIFTVANDDRIGGYDEHDYYYPPQQRVVVVTRKFVQMLDFAGRTEWSVPYQPSYPTHPRINIFKLGATNQFAVEFEPDYEANKKSGWKLPVRFEWLTTEKGISKSVDLPYLTQPKSDDFGDQLTCLLMPPPLAVANAISDDLDLLWALLSVIPASLCAIAGWWQGRRYSFPAKAQIGWGVFHLLFGLPGLLAFLSVQEWPARETCPRCKKLRVVDREKCPHCGADFAPPERTGTEIFEPLAAN